MGWYCADTRLGGSFRRTKRTSADGNISVSCTIVVHLLRRILMPWINRCFNSEDKAVLALLPCSRTSLGLDGPKPPEIRRDQMQMMPPTTAHIRRNLKQKEVQYVQFLYMRNVSKSN